MSIDASKRIIILNRLAYLVSFISLTLGIAVYFVTAFLPILFVELFIGLGLLTVPILNKKIGYRYTLLLVFLVLNAALVFYGIILGPQAQIHIVIGFLVGGAWILTDNMTAKVVASGYTIAMIAFLQLSYYYHWFNPIKIEYRGQMVVTWVVIITGSVLTCSVIYCYRKYWVNAKEKKLISDLEKANLAKRVFVREIGHELRNEITTIFSMAQILNEAPEQETVGENKSLVEDIASACHQVTLTCNNLLEQAKDEEGITYHLNNSSFPVRPFFQKNIKLNQYRANSKHVTLELFTEGMPANIITDKNKLTQILNNLLSNAIKYSVSHSTVTVRVSPVQNDRWMLEVKDSGPGISPEKQKHVFDLFFTDENMRGTGLGLAISQRLASELDGQIFVRSNPGEGSTFTALFKMMEASPDTFPTKPELFVTDSGPKNSTVLIIEDDAMNSKAVEIALEPLFKKVFTAYTGIAGLKIAIQELPDIIILDYHLPDTNGIAVLGAIRNNSLLNHTQVFMISGNENENDRYALIAAGAKSFIEKPFNISELRAIVGMSLKKKSGIMENPI